MLKHKVLAFLICILFCISLSACENSLTGTAKTTEMAETIAIAQIQGQVISKYDVDVYDVTTVDSDNNGRYIVTATTKDNAFETWWAVCVEICDNNNHYRAVANYHGDGITQEQWIDKYKTEESYAWGQQQAIYEE